MEKKWEDGLPAMYSITILGKSEVFQNRIVYKQEWAAAPISGFPGRLVKRR
jgi:hypothetical protein